MLASSFDWVARCGACNKPEPRSIIKVELYTGNIQRIWNMKIGEYNRRIILIFVGVEQQEIGEYRLEEAGRSNKVD